MKTFKSLIVLLAFAGLLLVGCSEQSQSPVSSADQSISVPGILEKNVNIEFEGIMNPTGVDPNAGFTKYPDGKIIVRGTKQTISLNVTYPNGSNGLPDLLSGTGELELNGTADFNTGEGDFWGNLVLTPNAPEAQGGQWKLTWHGKGKLSATGWTLPLKELGHGNGGALTGMQCFLENTITAAPTFYPWSGEAKGYIKTH
jgi:hypothetical protein